jgi:DNA-binding XRE family transcriptional regulator
MRAEEFIRIRKLLGKTQKGLASLLGGSVKAVCSYEQGWRSIPIHVERQMLFLLFLKEGGELNEKPCWDIRSCPAESSYQCPAWEISAGGLCWFVNGTVCRGMVLKTWAEKIALCKECPCFPPVLKEILSP